MIVTHQVKQGSEEWHALRVGKVTASNAYTLLTKGRKAATGTHNARFSNWYAERGHILEDEAIELYKQIYDCEVERPGFITNDAIPDAGYSPDGLAPELPLEVKCFMSGRHLECIEFTPSDVIAQVQFGLMITELPKAQLIFYNPDLDDPKLCFIVKDIVRDELIIKRFRAALGLE